MRTIFTQAKRHDTGKWEIVFGPEVRMKEHRKFIKACKIAGESSLYSEISLSFPGRTIKLRKKEAKDQARAKRHEPVKVVVPPVIPVPKKTAAAKRSLPTRLFGSRALKPVKPASASTSSIPSPVVA